MPTFQLDGQEIPFQPGDTILKAAHRAGIDIPHYCWHPGLSVAANCRMCLVELEPPPGRPAMMLDVVRFDPEKDAYVVEQKPKLVPACQQIVQEGNRVKSETSPHVEKARAAVQELLLLNHPVDCPICDQAGECRLQDYWLAHQHAPKRMRDEPIHKPKAIPFGPTIVYDAERCILCTRCVRFCEEVAKDPVLAVRQRGNLNEIVVAPGRELDHDYTLMTEHVCPVGALTSIDFRFKARVWFLRGARTVCTGCATGCNSFTDYDPRTQTIYRIRPRENSEVNGYWMCDEGMLDYRRLKEGRIAGVAGEKAGESAQSMVTRASEHLKNVPIHRLGIVLGAEFSQEDNAALLWLGRHLGVEAFFESGRPSGKADEILKHADKNPNSAGVRRLLGTEPRSITDLLTAIEAGELTHLLCLGGELKDSALCLRVAASRVSLVVLASHQGPLTKMAKIVLPSAAWAEEEATYVNARGVVQRTERVITPPDGVRPAWRWVLALARAMAIDCGFSNLAQLREHLLQGPSVETSSSPTESGVVSS